MEILIILACIVVLVIWYFIATEFYNIAVMKGYAEKKYFWWTFLFSIAGMLMVVALPTKQAEKKQTVVSDELPDL